MSSVCPAKFVREGNYDDRCLASGKFAFLSCKKSEQPPVPRNVQSSRLECIIRFAWFANQPTRPLAILLFAIAFESNTSRTRRKGRRFIAYLFILFRRSSNGWYFRPFQVLPGYYPPVAVYRRCIEDRTYLNDDTRRSNEIPENPAVAWGKK